MDQQNYGVIDKPPAGQDYVAGEETGIVYEELIAPADWSKYLSPGEIQKTTAADMMNCVTHSLLNELEAQFNYLLAAGILTASDSDFLIEQGYIIDGQVQFSKRFTAKMSNTSALGNSAQAVADSARNHGLLPQKDWEAGPDMTWDQYYAAIPADLIAKAKRIREIVEIKYEFVWHYESKESRQELIKKHLKQAPLQILAPVCSPWATTGIIKSCGKTQAQHATTIYNYEDLKILGDFDHYYPTRKRLAWDYYIPYVFKGVVLKKAAPDEQNDAQDVPNKPGHTFTQPIRYGQRSAEVKALQDALKFDGSFPANVPSTGYYGNITAAAVTRFQKKYNIALAAEIAAIAGRNVGPVTRNKLNEITK